MPTLPLTPVPCYPAVWATFHLLPRSTLHPHSALCPRLCQVSFVLWVPVGFGLLQGTKGRRGRFDLCSPRLSRWGWLSLAECLEGSSQLFSRQTFLHSTLCSDICFLPFSLWSHKQILLVHSRSKNGNLLLILSNWNICIKWCLASLEKIQIWQHWVFILNRDNCLEWRLHWGMYSSALHSPH